MNTQKRLHKIAKRILSDLEFSTREQLDDYLKKYPNTRPDTKFFVDGIEVKVDSQSKKTEKNNNVVDAILKKHSFLKGEKGMENIYKKILEKEGNLDNVPERAKEAAFKFVNSRLGKGNELSRKSFDLLFESGLEKFQDGLKKEEERKKREEEERKKREEEERKKMEEKKRENKNKLRGEIISKSAGSFKKMTRKKHFETINEKLTHEGIEPLTLEEYKEVLDKDIIGEPKLYGENVGYDNKFAVSLYIDNHFLKTPQFGGGMFGGYHQRGCSIRHLGEKQLRTTTKQLKKLMIDFPVLHNKLAYLNDDRQADESEYASLVTLTSNEDKDYYSLNLNCGSVIFGGNYYHRNYEDNEEAYESMGCYIPPLSSDTAKDEEGAMQMVVTHEIGHLIFFIKMKEEEKKPFSKHFNREQIENSKLYKKWESFYDKLMSEGGFPTIYSEENIEDFFAECFALFNHGKKEYLPDDIIKEMEEIVKWCSAMR